MLFGLFWGDWTVLLLIPTMIFAFWAQINVQSTFKKYSAVRNTRGLTGADVARRILNENGLYHIQVEHIHGHLNDHYDPKAGVIRLSDAVYTSMSAAAIGVAAHEAGHACQHATNYLPIKIRAAIIPVTNIGSMLAMPIFLLGLIFAGGAWVPGQIGEIFMFAGILLFSLSTVFQLITLPTEFNASSRALKTLEVTGSLQGEELTAASKTLQAAALTYVAALATSLASLLRLILIANRRR